MTKMKILLSLIILSSAMNGQDQILNLLPGKWKIDTDRFEAYEEWTIKDDTEITGISFSTKNNQKKINEVLYVKKVGNFWAYIAAPKNQKPALFYLTSSENDNFVFENPEHDFPQKLIYHFTKKNTIEVTIHGVENGEPKEVAFTFVKVE